MTAAVSHELAELAEAYGVASWYLDGARRRVNVAPEVVVAVLAQLDVAAGSSAEIRRSLEEFRSRRAQRAGLPGTLTVRRGESHALPAGTLRGSDGTEYRITDALPTTLAPDWYTLTHGRWETSVLVAPDALAPVPDAWGWMIQLYSLHSPGSWGIGDFHDLRDLVHWSGRELGAGLVLCNPLDAPTPVTPLQTSPYSPSSRRFTNPVYLRLADTAEYAAAEPELRRRVDQLCPPATELIDYDAVWAAKLGGLSLLWPLARRTPIPGDGALREFATFCALAERHGGDWRRWPAGLRRPDGPQVAAASAELAERIAFHCWVQHLCAEQLGRVRDAASDAGMPIGVVHDLPVGVDRGGADAWAWQDVLAGDCSVGAPPDAFNAAGQDWGLPPWRPDRLAATGHRAYRDVLDAALRHGGGLRVDHVAGLFRLWWIPPGGSPADGTYVRYDSATMIGALTLAAHQHGAMVVGEDLGTVEPEVTEALRQRHMLGCEVLWFARDESADGAPLRPPADWPREATASISTHDLPTAAGFLTGEHVRVRDQLGLLRRPVDEEWAEADAARAELLALLRAEGLLDGTDPQPAELIAAMHALLARTPCRVKLAAPTDVSGDPRQPNLPGTTTAYPNWRLPLRLSLPELMADPGVARVAELLRERHGDPDGTR